MKKWKWGYKVLLGWGSVYEQHTRGVRYPYRAETRPRPGFGPLAVFNSLEEAIMFRNQELPWATIHPCVYQESEETTLWEICHGMRRDISWSLPRGTRLADVVIVGIDMDTYFLMGK